MKDYEIRKTRNPELRHPRQSVEKATGIKEPVSGDHLPGSLAPVGSPTHSKAQEVTMNQTPSSCLFSPSLKRDSATSSLPSSDEGKKKFQKNLLQCQPHVPIPPNHSTKD